MRVQPRGMNAPEMDDSHPSDSAVQRDIATAVLDRLGELNPGWKLVDWKTTSAELGLAPLWQKAKPDAVWMTDLHEIVVAECYLRVDELKPGHRRKLAMDALKLLALNHSLPAGSHVRFLLVVPEELVDRLKGGSWFPVALRLAAEIVPMALLDSERQKLGDAAKLQAQGQARTKRVGKGRAE